MGARSWVQPCLARSQNLVFSVSLCPPTNISVNSRKINESSTEIRRKIDDTEKAASASLLSKGHDFIPTHRKNIEELYDFFLLTPHVVDVTINFNPELVLYPAHKIVKFIQAIVEVSDFTIISQAEAFHFLARAPEILSRPVSSFRSQLSTMLFTNSEYDLPWNMLLIQSPRSVFLEPEYVRNFLCKLEEYFTREEIRDLVGNNPDMLFEKWEGIQDKMKFLQKTMNVSAYRISVSPKSLTFPLDLLQARYSFLSLSGNYLHPDPKAKAARPMEATPLLHHITDTTDEKFVLKFCRGLHLEEWHVFLTLREIQKEDAYLEKEEDDIGDDEENKYRTANHKKSSKQSKNNKAFFS